MSVTRLVRLCMALLTRDERTEEDAADIRVLARELSIRSLPDALAVVEQYYDPDRLPVRSRLLLQEMFDDLA